MRRAIHFLGWMGVSLTILTLVLTFLTTYQFTYVKYFNSYETLQWCIFFTMVVLAINMVDFKASFKNVVYPVACILIAVGTIFFIYMKVY
ncbi:hypothetical protein [Clostridium sp. OS1-26]|uniref:hypothetical protein n=1 Tax=Clostridium sp. OS1-26 TaxID=3070681 RepID=UPI0027DF9012|nr:hypothetical protein [Clostridium sp. OS1-26]WML36027.1 hypothetical protein RCG18_04695 [Clostridium sp. OS1-26]